MSYESLADNDLDLKIRMMNILWNLGWFVRPNVKLYQYQEGKRTTNTFTDLDVLAIKLLPLQNPITAVCSAKSGKESDSTQIFWLAGVKSYFGASFAYYVRTKASLLKAKSLCQKLDIIPLNEEQLRIMEERFSIGLETSVPLFNFELYKRMHGYFNELKEKKLPLYNYITERFWVDSPHNQLLRIVTAIQDVGTLALSQECSLFVKYYTSALFTLPLFHLVQSLLTTPTNQVRSQLETALMGGEFARSEKRKIIEAVKSFLEEFVKHTRLPNQLVEEGIDFERMFTLDFAGDLYDLVLSMVEHYRQSIYAPRILDALAHQTVRQQGITPRLDTISLPELLQSDWRYATKLTKDILIFVQRLGGFTKSEIAV